MIDRILFSYLYSGVLFTPESLLCAIPFCLRLPRRNRFLLRLLLTVLAYFLISVALSSIFLIESESPLLYSLLQIVYYTLLGAFLIVGIFVCFDVNMSVAVVAGIGGYATQHLAYSLFSLLFFLIFGEAHGKEYACAELLFCIPVAAVVWLLLLRKSDFTEKVQIRDVRFLLLVVLAFFSCIALNSVAVGYRWEKIYSVLVWGVCRPYAILCSVLLLMVEFGFTREDSLKREKELIEVLLHYEKEQHKIRTESMDVINMKCHDLKHQLLLLRNATDKKAYDELYGEVATAIDGFYDTGLKTGNDTLDLVLAEQLMRCKKLGIDLECAVDASGLCFLKSSDVAALFGNALDNAVQAVRDLPEEKRLIALEIKQRAGAIFIHVENCCGKLNFAGDMPITDKPDKRYHGFGVKSIFHIANRYGGTPKVYLKDGKFNLDILFLLDEVAEKIKNAT